MSIPWKTLARFFLDYGLPALAAFAKTREEVVAQKKAKDSPK